ncbi:MAG: cation-translocating P-type ATPase [Chloroflexi bacterium]|nr:cation-translocating P-type ATPase [Chloroflexota bacterium]
MAVSPTIIPLRGRRAHYAVWGADGAARPGSLGVGGPFSFRNNHVMVALTSESEQAQCTLCGLTTALPLTNTAGDFFCCPACLEVSALLAESPSPTQTMAASGQCETTAVSLSGLWCPSCAWLINERLDRAPGIQSADVNFIQREAQVSYDPAQTSPRRIARQIKQFGYGARLAGDKPHNEEEAQWNLLLVSGVLVMHIMILSFMLYFREWTGRASADTEWMADIFRLMIAVISVPVIFLIGLPILRAGAASLLRGRPNTHTLIAIGAFAALGLSVRNLMVGQSSVYFDTAAILLFLMAVGHWLELRAQKVSGEAVERLWQQIPSEATWLTADGWQTTPADKVSVGTRVRVRPGKRFPVDGVVAVGEGDVDESVVTGEPDPVPHNAGDKVLAGTVNLDGTFELITTAVSAETVVGQIGRLLHQALWQRAPVEQLADKLAAHLVPIAVILSLASFAFWTWWDSMETGLIIALSVLLIACPCALGIATPLTLWVGLGRAAEEGIILRYTAVLERLAAVKQIYFDKTGTLTQRPIRLQKVDTDGVAETEFMRWVTAVESYSEHPLGQAIVSGAEQQFSDQAVHHFRVWPGQGVSGTIDDTPVWIGNRRLMEYHELTLPSDLQETAATWQEDDLTVVYAGWHGRVRGLIGLGELIRDDALETIQQLQALETDVAVLTGDDENAGRRWRRTLNIPVYAEQRPEDKVARLQAATGQTAMVGDGINDGPALAAAAVGLAVRQGTDVAQSAADVILLHDDLRAVPWLMGLSTAAMRKVKQNLAWAIGYNSIGLLLAITGFLQPSLAALLMVLSNLIVTTNALRLRRTKIVASNE